MYNTGLKWSQEQLATAAPGFQIAPRSMSTLSMSTPMLQTPLQFVYQASVSQGHWCFYLSIFRFLIITLVFCFPLGAVIQLHFPMVLSEESGKNIKWIFVNHTSNFFFFA